VNERRTTGEEEAAAGEEKGWRRRRRWRRGGGDGGGGGGGEGDGEREVELVEKELSCHVREDVVSSGRWRWSRRRRLR